MKLKITLASLLIITGVIASIVASSNSPMSDVLPDGAVIYAETSNLPDLIDKISESDSVNRYYKSRNFKEFKDGRLGLRIAEKFKDLSDGLGLPVNSVFLKGLAENRAAVAVYDIGGLDLVFVAPVKESFFKASLLLASDERLGRTESRLGNTIYSIAIETDNGRTKRKLMFCLINGKFVLATSEKLMARAELIVSGRNTSGRLSDEDSFRRLAHEGEGRLLRVWVNQQELDRDYYYRKYWLSRGNEEIGDVVSGMFSVEVLKGEVVEHRKYLLSSNTGVTAVSSDELRSLEDLVPAYAHFASFKSTGGKESARAVLKLLFGDRATAEKTSEKLDLADPDDFFDSSSYYYGYEYLDSRFDQQIDEVKGTIRSGGNRLESNSLRELQRILSEGKSSVLLELGAPTSLPVPMFADFRRGGAVMLKRGIDISKFETTVKRLAEIRAGVSGASLRLVWQDEKKNGVHLRRLDLPMLGRTFFYARIRNGIVFSNSEELISGMLDRSAPRLKLEETGAVASASLIDLKNGRDDFEAIFGRLDQGNPSTDFFRGNIASLFSSFPNLETVQTVTREKGSFAEKKIVFKAAR